MLVAHLAIHAIQGFLAAINTGFDTVAAQPVFNRVQNLADQFAPVAPRRTHRLGESAVPQRQHVRERQILQFTINVVETQAVRDRHIDFQCLACDAPAFLGRHRVQRAHIVQTVGELDENDAHVAGHGQQHFAEILGLLLDLTLEFDLVEFGQTINQCCDWGAKALDQFIFLDVLILHHVVEQRRHDGLCVELPIGTDFGHGDGVRDIRLAGFAHLTQMHFIREAVGFLDFFQFGWVQVLGQPVDQLGNGSHPSSRGGFVR